MLRKRVITVLTFNEGVLFRTKLFRPDYRYTLNFVDAWSVDEIVVLDVTRAGGEKTRDDFLGVIQGFSKRCFVPLAAGGGLRDMDDVDRYMGAGADKIVVNTGAIERPEFITDVAKRYGSQCVVVSIDARQREGGAYEVFSHLGSIPTGLSPADWAMQAQELGAGEVLITSIDRDGWLQGYDLELIGEVVDAVSFPVLALGGAGTWDHLVEGFRAGADGACTQNIYHFTERSILSAKAHLKAAGLLVRE